MVNNKLVALVASSLASTISAANVIRLNSPGDKTTVIQRSDPIVSFGSVSAHSHDFFGSSAMSPSQTYEQLLQGNCTSIIDANGFEVTPDHSVYWYPTLLMRKKGGQGFLRVPTVGRTVYYKNVGQGRAAEPFEFPEHFSMVATDPLVREPFGPDDDRRLHVEFNCGNVNRGVMPEFQRNLPNDCGDYPGYFATLHFPHCWNEQPFSHDAPRAHMKYPIGHPETGPCPESHPVRLPHLEMQVHWHLKAILDQVEPDSFILSHGDETGRGFHGDFENGWEKGVLSALLAANVPGQEFDVGVIRAARPDLLPPTTKKGIDCQLPAADYVENVEEPDEFLCGCNLPARTLDTQKPYGILPVGKSRGDCDVNPAVAIPTVAASVSPAPTTIPVRKRELLKHMHKHARSS